MQLMQSKKIITFHKPLPPTARNVERSLAFGFFAPLAPPAPPYRKLLVRKVIFFIYTRTVRAWLIFTWYSWLICVRRGGEQDRATRTPYRLKRVRFRVFTMSVLHEAWIMKQNRFGLIHFYCVHFITLSQK